MDTPERSKIGGGTPLSKFEDSPVFNFINNLSPIQPVKPIDSVHTAHTYQCLNFASFCSIFSSPHDNPPRETRILTRPPFTDFAKHEKFSENIGESSLCTEISDAVRPYRSTAASEENRTITCSLNEATVDPPDQCPTLSSPFAQSMQNDSGSPDHNTTPKYSVKMDLKLDVGHAPVDLVDIVQNGIERQKNLFAMETGVPENHPLELSKDEVIGCDWENLISDDAADMLIFDSSTESEAHKGVEENIVDNDGNLFVSLLSNCTENADYLQQTQPDISHDPCVQNITQDPPNCDEDSMKEHETDHATKMQSGTHQNQVDNHQQRGMRRRCLVYEVAGVSKRNIYSDSNLNPSTPLPSKGKSICDTNSLKPTISPSLCALPGIGLHLNTLATTSKDRMINKETLASDKSMPCFIDPFLSTTAGMNRLRKSLAIENDLCPSGKTEDLQVILHDASKETTLGNCEELSQGSPKKKRRKSENGGESEGCKRCNCKKSKCLKLYCECFAAGVYCSEPCSCQGCLNKPIHEETVLATRKQIESRNPLAFAPKVIRTSDAGLEMGDDDNKTPASARHKRGCNCKKSNCLKKYCECYQGGVGCSISCRCEGCKNAFGRKYGVEEIEQMKEETNACDKEKESLNVSQQTANIQIEDHHSSGNILTITPLQSCRLSVEPSLLSSAKPLQSTKLSIGCSPGSYGSHMLRKSEMLLSQHKLENNVNTILEDDTPAILRPCASPNNGVKIASPNRKRVSPPRNGVGLSPPNRKGCRKLILKSIPSFPSLNSDVSIEYPVNYSNSSFNSSTVS